MKKVVGGIYLHTHTHSSLFKIDYDFGFEEEKFGCKNKRAAFTLVEILITLGIIGVISAMTIPTLIKNANERATVSQLKNIYSILNSATNSIIAQEGPISTWTWDEAGQRMDAVVDSYKNQLLFSKTCAYGVNTCYYESTWKALDGNVYFWYFGGGDAYYNILNDGTYVKFEKNAGAGAVSANLKARMVIIVNLNGNKPPNQMGRDVFCFYLTENKGLIPPDLNVTGNCKTNSGGATCSTKILQEDAINY